MDALTHSDHRDLLDTVDKLRTEGLSKYVDLPQIIVCGDQSAGKSSVLEALSTMSFPIKDNICTRFATELILRRSGSTKLQVSITPGDDRTKDEAERLRSFCPKVDTLQPNIGSIVEEAKVEMCISETKPFSNDTLRVELSGPAQPHLTMVDLPGLYRAGSSDQGVEYAKVVREKVRSYMKSSRSIILCVVSAKSDSNLQEVTELARELDPAGIRTIGLITKPDTLDVGSDSEAKYVRMAQNKGVSFRLGWHVLKNRSYEMRNATFSERDAAEETFFQTGLWNTIDPSHLGVKHLKPRLSKVLGEQILDQLPSLLVELDTRISTCQLRLKRFGDPRKTLKEQRRYLLKVSQDFSSLMTASIEGFYNDPFFESAMSDKGYEKRLRAVVQNSLTDFGEQMNSNGHTRTIVDSPSAEPLPPGHILRTSYLEEVKQLMRRTRGCELPGTFNPLIIGDLFREQCQNWEGVTTEAKDTILQAVYHSAKAIVEHVTANETSESILRVVNGRIDALQKDVDHKVTELLQPHYIRHPITYNHYLTDNVQKAQAERNRRKLEQVLAGLRQSSPVHQVKQAWQVKETWQVDPSELLSTLARETEPDMQRHASGLAVDYMQAYYKVALKRLVDDVSELAIEECLIQKLPVLFSPQLVHDMTDENVTRLALESEEATEERERYAQKLAVLEAGLQDLKRLDKHQGPPDSDAKGDVDGVGATPNGADGSHNGTISDAEPEKPPPPPTIAPGGEALRSRSWTPELATPALEPVAPYEEEVSDWSR